MPAARGATNEGAAPAADGPVLGGAMPAARGATKRGAAPPAPCATAVAPALGARPLPSRAALAK
ncbi:MAG: hypothetical protein QOH47_2958 [Sphingomonadales bacterium]|jgi:hypothetical protein|nr:hypothetical protein [Sphingomonadales bacterium]